LATVHREENTTNGERLTGIFEAFNRLANSDRPFIVPLHPRTVNVLNELGGYDLYGPHVRILEPVSYLDMVSLEIHAKAILTDSGGVQKEAYFAQVPCITLRDETEWVELIEHGFNSIAGCDAESICEAYGKMVDRFVSLNPDLYGGGTASKRIIRKLCSKTANLNHPGN
jgi:UDP-GlcNAc3NAcA epimerase